MTLGWHQRPQSVGLPVYRFSQHSQIGEFELAGELSSTRFTGKAMEFNVGCRIRGVASPRVVHGKKNEHTHKSFPLPFAHMTDIFTFHFKGQPIATVRRATYDAWASEAPQCFGCLREQPEVTLRRCARCRVALYCGRRCQMADFALHQLACRAVETDRK